MNIHDTPPEDFPFEEEPTPPINLVPHSRELEEAVLGAVLIDPRLLPQLDLRAAHFYLHRHGFIWEAARACHAQAGTFDILTLTEELNRRGQLVEIGGPAYLVALVNAVPFTYHAPEYAGQLRDLAARRDLIQLANQMAEAAFQVNKPLLETQARLIEQLTQITPVQQNTEPLAAWMARAEARIARVAETGVTPGMMTGYTDFDALTGGLQGGRLIVVSGEPGMGKTIWAENLARNLAKNHYPGNFYSSEMPEEDMSNRMLSAETGLEVDALENGRLQARDWPLLAHAVEYLQSLPVYSSDASNWTVPALRADLTRAKHERGIRWFVFDYMNLLRDEYGESDIDRTKYLSRHLTYLCRDLDLCGIVVQSIVKSGFGKPGLEALAGSVQLAFDASLVLFVTEHTPDDGTQPSPDMRTVLVKKGRHLKNPRRYFYLYKQPNLPRFDNAVRPQQLSLNGRANGHTRQNGREILEFAR